MPTIAELQIKLDSRPIEAGTSALNTLGEASGRVTKALEAQKRAQDALGQAGAGGGTGRGGLGDPQATRNIKDLSSAIDNQTRRLKALQDQRTALNNSNLNVTNPAEFQRLNQVIDSNITLVNRQGNAVSRLARQVEAEQTALANKAQTERNRTEAQRRSVEAAERSEANRAQRQQTALDRTLAGLSAQIRAQQEYNRTVAELDRARSPTTGQASISSAEYDTYVRLAAAKRDEAFATRETGAENDRLKSKLESVTASLGRAERAQVQYDRSLRTLNQGLSSGLLGIDQYNTKLAQITQRRDDAVTAADQHAAAERRLQQQLNAITSAYDPLLAAQRRYDEATRTLSLGLTSGKLTVDQFNTALGQQVRALDEVKRAQPNSQESQSKRYQEALDRLLPYNAQLRNLAEAERVLNQQRSSGGVQSKQQIEQYNRATEAIAKQRAEIERITNSQNSNTMSAKAQAAALRGVPAQITDIVVSLQGGQAPLTVLLQQGGQLKDMFGGVIPAVKALTQSIVAMINPATILVTTLIGLGFAANAGSNEVLNFNRAIITSRNAAGVSSSEFGQLRTQIDGIVGTSRLAAEALTLIAQSGAIAGDNFERVAVSAISFSRETGTALKDIIADFASLGKDPVNAAVTLDEKYKFLTSSTLAQVAALVQQGREYEATSILQEQLAGATETAANKMNEQLNKVGRTVRALRDGFSELIDEIYNIGRANTTADELAELQRQRTGLQEQLATNEKVFGGFGASGLRARIETLDTEIKQKQTLLQYQKFEADQEKELERIRREGVTSANNLERARISNLSGVAAAQEKINGYERDAARIRAAARAENRALTAEENKLIESQLAAGQKSLKDAQEAAARKGAGGNVVDNTSVQEVRSNLRLVQLEYESAYKKIEELGKTNVVSQSATNASLIGVLTQQRDAVTKSYDDQISEIKRLQDNKKNTAAQNVSLENQLTRAEGLRLEAIEKNNTRIEQINTRERGILEERARNVAQYQDALNQQLSNLQDTGARNAAGVGRGDRQAEIARQLDQQNRSFARQRQRLAEGNLDPDEYNQKLAALTKAHTDMSEQIIANDKAVQESRRNGFNGLTAAIENAQDVGNDFASSVERGLTGAFQRAGDALGEFVTTGQFSFRSFASSIISDLARIAAQQASSAALGGILSIATSAASAYFGGGANGFARGSAGATSSALGASSAGYGAAYGFKNGGAFDSLGQVNRFANGGTFGTLTNSIVSTPTRFAYGGQIGELGEAGPEAILPLQKSANGALGVRAQIHGGGGGVGQVIVNVQVTESGSSSQSSDPAYTQFGDQLGVYVRRSVYDILNKESSDGGLLNQGQQRR